MRRVAIIVGVVLAVIVVCALSAFAILYVHGCSEVSQHVSGNQKVIAVDGQQYQQKDGIVSICFIGEDKDSTKPVEGYNGQADVIIVLALDTKSGAARGIVIPRDSMVAVNRTYTGDDAFYDTKELQICLSYAYGTDDASSSELACKAASRILYNIPIDYYYTMRMDGVGALADAVDGVSLTALATIPETSIVEGEEVSLKGDDALQYIWWRDENAYGSALERQERQMQFCKSLASELIGGIKQYPISLFAVAGAMNDFATTNMSIADIVYLVSTVAGKAPESFDLACLEGEVVHDDRSPWEQYRLDDDAVLRTVLDIYYEPLSD